MLIYHERQEASLCGQHCVNNLLGGPYFSEIDLAELAAELDARERELMLSHGTATQDALNFLAEDSGNVDESGNFSEQVLRTALERSHGVSLKRRVGEESSEAFVCNHEKHWIALRCFEDQWFDLNSLLDRPKPVSAFYLDAYLHQLEQEGYDIFAVEGRLPMPMQDPSLGNPSFFHPSETLLGSTAPEVEAAGQRLGRGRRQGNHMVAHDDVMHDDALRIAMAMSLADQGGSPANETIATRLPNELPEEPSDSAASTDVAQIRLRLPDGTNVKHRFRKGDKVSLLWVLVNHGNEAFDSDTLAKLRIRSRSSTQELELAECLETGVTFEEAGFVPSAAVFVVSG